MIVHNHGSEEGRGLDCPEFMVDGRLVGACMRSTGEYTAENDARPQGCVCADIADVAGSRLSDALIASLCDRLRPSVTPPGASS